MPDILIRDVPAEDLARIDEHAKDLGLSRGEHLRRLIAVDAARKSGRSTTVEDLKRLAELAKDLLDEDVMRAAWS
jgi:hypothetical protein